MKKILIIGGNRFVGKALAKVLLDKGYMVDVFNRSGTSPDDRVTYTIKGDRNKDKDLWKIDINRYDGIVDMCLYKHSQFELLRKYIRFTRVRAMARDLKYIFVSSGAADERYIDYYGDYGKEKLEIETALESTPLNYKIVRPSYIVGIGNHRPRLGHYIDQLSNAKKSVKVDGDGKNKINVVFVQDVVKVLETLIDDDVEGKKFDVCGNISFTVVDLVKRINKELNSKKKKSKRVKFSFNKEDAILPKNTFVFDNKKTKKELGITFTNFTKGLKEYIKWYKNEKNL